MNACRVCQEEKPLHKFAVRGRETSTCLKCSNARKTKDYCCHGTREHDCKMCVDPIIRRATSIVQASRIADKRNGMNTDVDFAWAIDAVCSTPECYYCEVPMQYTSPYENDFATVDRVDNTLGHLKKNCVIACRSCNCGHGRSFTQKWKTISFNNLSF